jgi:short-subunit dehydrogenase
MKWALVTGASSGMGKEYARQLAERGYNIVVVSNNDDGNRCVAEYLEHDYCINAVPIYADLAAKDGAQRLYQQVAERGYEVEILVSNAGMLLFSQLEHTAVERIEQIIALHCTAPTLLCRFFAEDMRRRGEGRILIVSSITAWTPYPTISHYAATKAYLKSFGESLWYELRGTGVSVTTVFPSAVDTPFYNLDEKMRRRLLRCGVMMRSEEVVRKALTAMFRSRKRSLPGFITKLEAAICAILPSWVLLLVMKLPAVKRVLERV